MVKILKVKSVIASVAWQSHLCVIARSEETWQSHTIKVIPYMRLLHSVRNDSIKVEEKVEEKGARPLFLFFYKSIFFLRSSWAVG
jgi:hypothetical protein